MDDDPVMLRLLAVTFEQSGYQLLLASGGREALTLVQAERPALVVLDVKMPDVNGLQVCRTIKGDPVLAPTVVVMLSAWTQEHEEAEGLAAGADAYHKKPFSPESLRTQVARLLRAESAASDPPADPSAESRDTDGAS